MFTYSLHNTNLNYEYNKNGIKYKSAQKSSISRVALVSVFFVFVYLNRGSEFELLQQHGTTWSLTSFCLYAYHRWKRNAIIIA
jgi:hypothetical protein